MLLLLAGLLMTTSLGTCVDDFSLSTLQTMIEQQASTIQALQAQLTATKNDLATTKNELTSTQARLQAVESKLSPTVGFSVQFNTDPVQVGNHATLKFDHFVTNLGGCYDALTGIFTAPVSGLYVFYLNIMSKATQDVEARLIKEGVALDFAHASGGTSDQGTLLITVHLDHSQRVWIEHSYGSESFRGGPWTVFTGFLLKAL